MSSGYLRYPHIHGDLLTFVAGDDVWLAPAAGGRAWRLSADDVPVSYPRFSRDGSRVAWSSSRDGNPEVYCAEVDGSTAARLTYWGDPQTRVTGWTAAGRCWPSPRRTSRPSSTGEPTPFPATARRPACCRSAPSPTWPSRTRVPPC